MALQDLTPQLRTRLGKVERLVGVFVTVATLLLVVGFGYYVRHMAKKKGWFDAKVEYSTGVNNAAGLAVGSKVKLTGFDAGEITAIVPNEPSSTIGVTVFFNVREPNFGYIWTDSKVKVVSGDLLGGRVLEVTKGAEYWALATVSQKAGGEILVLDHKLLNAGYREITNRLVEAEALKTGRTVDAFRVGVLAQKGLYDLQDTVKSNAPQFYVRRQPGKAYWIDAQESRPIGERLEQIGDIVEAALPSFLALTNQLKTILASAASATEKLDAMLSDARPAVTNLAASTTNLAQILANAAFITANLTNGQGSLGEWLITTNINGQLDRTFGSANAAIGSANDVLMTANTNLQTLNRSLEGIAGITSNLNVQVQANSNMLSSITQIVTNSDNFILGLQRHWLLRSAFKPIATNKPPKKSTSPPGPIRVRP